MQQSKPTFDRLRLRAASIALICMVAVIAPLYAAEPTDQPTPTGVLLVEGDDVESLVLVDRSGRRLNANPLDRRLALPPETYTVTEIHLFDGPSCIAPAGLTFRITEAAETPLKIGGPLKPKIKAVRHRTNLNLSYQLEDIGGHQYTAEVATARPPGFVVYKGDKVVGAGQFEYGWGGSCAYSWRVPITAFGKLSIAPAAYPDDPANAAVVTTYDWKPQYSLPVLSLWLLVAAAVLLPKENRHLRVIAILAPLVILLMAWSDFARLLSLSGLERGVYGALFTSMTAGIAILWLLSVPLGRKRRISTVAWALLIMAAACLAGIFAAGLGGEIAFQLGLAELVLTLAMLTSLALARLFTGAPPRPVAFSLWLILTTLVSCIAMMSALAVIVAVLTTGQHSVSIDRIMEILGVFLIVSVVASFVMYVVILLFLVGACTSAVYRRGFYQCLGFSLPQPQLESANPVPEIPQTDGR